MKKVLVSILLVALAVSTFGCALRSEELAFDAASGNAAQAGRVEISDLGTVMDKLRAGEKVEAASIITDRKTVNHYAWKNNFEQCRILFHYTSFSPATNYVPEDCSAYIHSYGINVNYDGKEYTVWSTSSARGSGKLYESDFDSVEEGSLIFAVRREMYNKLSAKNEDIRVDNLYAGEYTLDEAAEMISSGRAPTADSIKIPEQYRITETFGSAAVKDGKATAQYIISYASDEGEGHITIDAYLPDSALSEVGASNTGILEFNMYYLLEKYGRDSAVYELSDTGHAEFIFKNEALMADAVTVREYFNLSDKQTVH